MMKFMINFVVFFFEDLIFSSELTDLRNEESFLLIFFRETFFLTSFVLFFIIFHVYVC